MRVRIRRTERKNGGVASGDPRRFVTVGIRRFDPMNKQRKEIVLAVNARAPCRGHHRESLRLSAHDMEMGATRPTGFRVMLVRDTAGRFSGNRTFIEELERLVPDFYETGAAHRGGV